MATAKIRIKLGNIEIEYEGDDGFLDKDLMKLVGDLQKVAPAAAAANPGGGGGGGGKPAVASMAAAGDATVTLARHLKDLKAGGKQVRRFLATADWLRLKGDTNLTTTKVAKALGDNHQSRLGNPAECLNQNVGKGFCEKLGDGFYITPDGLKDLGYSE